MPTIGSQPSLKSTQAVGAILLHQFARERFLEAGLNDRLIKEAEAVEHIDDLTAVLLNDQDDQFEFQQDGRHSAQESMNDVDTTREMTNVSDANSTTSPIRNSNNTTLYHSMNHSSGDNNQPQTIVDRVQSMPSMANYGREFRRLAEEFEKDRLRQTVRNRAEQVKLTDITKEGFLQLLEELFKDNEITRERVVILFFFCTDVALRAASFAHELVVKLMGWSFSYIINSVCDWIHNNGGWDHVLFHRIPSFLINCCTALAIATSIVTMFFHLRKSIATGSS